MVAETIRLAASALGVFGGALLFVEFYQVPSYVDFDADIESYNIAMMPDEVSEYTGFGRVGALCLSLAFALLFVAELLN
jgi:hypothetical protein